MESFIKEGRVECSHQGSSARNSQVFSYCTSPSLGTSGCAVSNREEGWGCGLAVRLGWAPAIFHTPLPALYFLWVTVVSIEIAEAAFNSQELSHWQTHWVLQQTSTGECGGALGL